MASTASIIGAAISGPAAAMRLAQMGYDVTVREQRNEADLASAGILGITHGNWDWLQSFSVGVNRYELNNQFTDYLTGVQSESPFRYITWTGLHRALVTATESMGVRYQYGRRILPGDIRSDITVEATGVAGAARVHLPHHYSGFTIYRGLSQLWVGTEFTAYRETAGQYLTIGDTPDGAFWAFFVSRPEPKRLTTGTTHIPPRETQDLPDEFKRVVMATDEIFRTPMSDWRVPEYMHSPDRRYFTVGDVNGPVRPVTTSGANLAVMEGFNIGQLLSGDDDVEREMLERRAFDLQLGQELEGPEIGGSAEDVDYYQHHMMLFPGNYS